MKLNHVTSKTYTALACVVGFALMDDLSGNEQNALGNFLYLVGQVLETNFSIQQTIEEKIKGEEININSKQCKQGGSPFTENYIDKKVLKDLIKNIEIIKQKLEDIEKR